MRELAHNTSLLTASVTMGQQRLLIDMAGQWSLADHHILSVMHF